MVAIYKYRSFDKNKPVTFLFSTKLIAYKQVTFLFLIKSIGYKRVDFYY